jgi:hypothetical protein
MKVYHTPVSKASGRGQKPSPTQVRELWGAEAMYFLVLYKQAEMWYNSDIDQMFKPSRRQKVAKLSRTKLVSDRHEARLGGLHRSYATP